MNRDTQQQQESLRQDNLVYGGLIAIGTVMVQPFVAGATLDLPGTVCVIAFSVAIPLLAALLMVNRQEAFRGRATKSVVVTVARVGAQNCAFVGVVAGFWHILWIAGVGVLAGGLVGCCRIRRATCAWNATRSLQSRRATNRVTPGQSLADNGPLTALLTPPAVGGGSVKFRLLLDGGPVDR